MTQSRKNTSKYNVKKEQKIKLQDFYNTYACCNDDKLKSKMDMEINKLLNFMYQNINSSNDVINLWVDGSYNPKTNKSGIGIVIISDPTKPINADKNICFGKTVNAQSSLKAEIYALSIGLSYILDTYPDAKNLHVYYDCAQSTVCAANIDAFTHMGSPYTNFRSALRRLRKRNINVAFQHTKAHVGTKNNEVCDLIAKHYADIPISDDKKKKVKKIIREDM